MEIEDKDDRIIPKPITQDNIQALTEESHQFPKDVCLSNLH